jgi:hypothetical protein
MDQHSAERHEPRRAEHRPVDRVVAEVARLAVEQLEAPAHGGAREHLACRLRRADRQPVPWQAERREPRLAPRVDRSCQVGDEVLATARREGGREHEPLLAVAGEPGEEVAGL